jgi:23S rRNA (adenine2030-N6)-methyltransferase
MNYRHAFHAGNFADVFKHVILARILVHLREKPAPFRVIDSHAGAGLYDLSGDDANRTGEWRDGIGRLAGASLAAALGTAAAELIAPYLAACRDADGPGPAPRLYPGSPVIAARLLRPQDRLIACELEPTAAAALAHSLGAIRQAKAIEIDGWVALNAYLPPNERRGLVVLDPANEQPDDFARLAAGLAAAFRKWPTGIYMAWYPIKGRDGPDALARAVRRGGIEKALRLEMTVAPPAADGRLGGCGLIVVNPPWRLQSEAEIMLAALSDRLARGARSLVVDRIAP